MLFRLAFNNTSIGFSLLVSLLVVLLGSSQAIAESLTAEQWMEKMRTASVQSSYRGTFMFSRGGMSSSMRVVHRYVEGQEQERLTQLDGRMGEILRRGSEVTCLILGRKLVTLDKEQFSNPVSAEFSGFMPSPDLYSVSVAGEARVVDRAAIQLLVSAKDDARYSYSLWLDKPSGLLLKSEVLGLKGEPLESFQFTQIELPTETRNEEFAFDVDQEVVEHESIPLSQSDKRWPEQLVWEASFHPSGFVSIESAGAHGSVMLYSDGLASYSVFVEPKVTARQGLPEGASVVGAAVVYLSTLTFDGKEYSVTVAGEVPPMTAMKVAEGVRPVME